MEPFFVGAKSSDILILTAGLHYGIAMYKDSAVDFDAWIKESAINFQRAVNRYFPGRVFRVGLSSVRDAEKPDLQLSYYLHRVEVLLSKLFQEHDDPARPWFTIDQWAINEGRHNLYFDYVHYQGVLTHASLNNIFTEFCTN